MYIKYFYIWIEKGVTSVTEVAKRYSAKDFPCHTSRHTLLFFGVTGVTLMILRVTLLAYPGVTRM